MTVSTRSFRGTRPVDGPFVATLADIPAQGPLVVIANHPFGILDGLMMGHLLDTVRGDFRILANAVFRKAPDLDRVLLPISGAASPLGQLRALGFVSTELASNNSRRKHIAARPLLSPP